MNELVLEGIIIINGMFNSISVVFIFMVGFVPMRVGWLKQYLWGRRNLPNAKKPFENFSQR
jgi:hypothetical protein